MADKLSKQGFVYFLIVFLEHKFWAPFNILALILITYGKKQIYT